MSADVDVHGEEEEEEHEDEAPANGRMRECSSCDLVDLFRASDFCWVCGFLAAHLIEHPAGS